MGPSISCSTQCKTGTPPPPTPVQCGVLAPIEEGQGLQSSTPGLCYEGTVTNFTATAQGWTWDCIATQGNGQSNGCGVNCKSGLINKNGTCTASTTPIHAQCQNVAPISAYHEPVDSPALCAPGTQSNLRIDPTNEQWLWECLGNPPAGSNASGSCSVQCETGLVFTVL